MKMSNKAALHKFERMGCKKFKKIIENSLRSILLSDASMFNSSYDNIIGH